MLGFTLFLHFFHEMEEWNLQGYGKREMRASKVKYLDRYLHLHHPHRLVRMGVGR